MSDDFGQQTSLNKIMKEQMGDGEDDVEYSAPDIVGEVPDNWEIVTVKNLVVELLGGGTPDKSDEEYWDGEIPWASVKDLDGITLSKTEDYITQKGLDECASNLIPSHSIVISTRMTVGEPFVNKTEMAINQDMKGLIPDNDLVNTYYFVYNLLKKDRYLKSLGRGTTVDGITTSDLERTRIELPPLNEQRKIASILYNIDKAIQKTEKIIAQTELTKAGLAQDLIHSGLEEVDKKQTWMGEVPSHWEIKDFSSIISLSQNGIYKKSDKYGGDYPIIKMGDIFEDAILELPIEEQVHLIDKEINKHGAQEGDLVFARHAQAGWGAGDCTYIPELENTAVIESNMIHIRLNSEVNPLFYAQYFNSEVGVNSIKRITTEGNIKSVSQKDLLKLKIPIPPKQEQDDIADKLTSFDKTISKTENKLNIFHYLKLGLMQDLLSGNIRTTNQDIDVLPEVKKYG